MDSETNKGTNHVAHLLVHDPHKLPDALKYLDDIKVAYPDQPEVYDEFLDCMKAYREKRYVLYLLILKDLDTDSWLGSPRRLELLPLIERITKLFVEKPVFVHGLNHFLPPGTQLDAVRVDDGSDPELPQGNPKKRRRLQ